MLARESDSRNIKLWAKKLPTIIEIKIMLYHQYIYIYIYIVREKDSRWKNWELIKLKKTLPTFNNSNFVGMVLYFSLTITLTWSIIHTYNLHTKKDNQLFLYIFINIIDII